MVGCYGQSEIYHKRKHLEAMVWSLLWWLVLLPGVVLASLQEDTAVHVSLRMADGAAMVGETITLERLPEGEAVLPTCTTDAAGRCTWYVGRGLYQVLFTRPLDNISALAVAEGGLQGLGITVGDEAVTYHFTFHTDGRVYFDAAPEAAVPSPIIPVGDTWHGGTVPTPTLTVIEGELVEETPTPEPTRAPDAAVDPSSGSSWRLILFIAGGLVIGGSFHLWSRKKQTSGQKTRRQKDQATNRPTDQETPHA